MKMKKVILGSGSPRRRELLAAAGYEFGVVVSDAAEISDGAMPPSELAVENARLKARAVADACTGQDDAVVIGADTVVALDGRIFGKPADENDARRMLRELSGNTHQVVTGVCLLETHGEEPRSETVFAETSLVAFRELDHAEIDAYVATGEPLDKAGAYGIQGGAGAFVDHIEGDYDNIVGLPVATLAGYLEGLGAARA